MDFSPLATPLPLGSPYTIVSIGSEELSAIVSVPSVWSLSLSDESVRTTEGDLKLGASFETCAAFAGSPSSESSC